MHPAGVSLRDSPSLRKVRPSWAPSTGEGASDTHGPPRAPGRQINSSLPVRIAEAPPIPSPTHATHAARHKRRSGSTSTVRHHAACPAVHARAECTASARQVHKRCRAQRRRLRRRRRGRGPGHAVAALAPFPLTHRRRTTRFDSEGRILARTSTCSACIAVQRPRAICGFPVSAAAAVVSAAVVSAAAAVVSVGVLRPRAIAVQRPRATAV